MKHMHQNVWMHIWHTRIFREQTCHGPKVWTFKSEVKELYDFILQGGKHPQWHFGSNLICLKLLYYFFYFRQTVGSVFLCFGRISISLGELFLIWVPQTWSGSLWCQKWDSNAEAQWKAGPHWSGGHCAQIHPKRPTIPNGHSSARAHNHFILLERTVYITNRLGLITDLSWQFEAMLIQSVSQSEHYMSFFRFEALIKCISWCLTPQRMQAKVPFEWKTLKAITIHDQKRISVHFRVRAFSSLTAKLIAPSQCGPDEMVVGFRAALWWACAPNGWIRGS